MKVQTMSVVVGDYSCNATCPFCIAKISDQAVLTKDVNWRNFRIACKLASQSGANTILLTGKGEPTLHPELIQRYIGFLAVNFNFPFVELQTNGIKLADPDYFDNLVKWYETGLTTICLSAVHYDRQFNQKIYGDKYPDIKELVAKLHSIGFTVRLSTMLLKGYIDGPLKIESLINFCRINGISQLTVRPIDTCSSNKCKQSQFVDQHTLLTREWEAIKIYVERFAKPILNLAHGATVYDLDGQNICLGTCMTTNKTENDVRQLIFFPNGEIRHDWKYKSAVLLKGKD